MAKTTDPDAPGGHPFEACVDSSHMDYLQYASKVGLVIPYFNFFDNPLRKEALRQTLAALSPAIRTRTIVVEALTNRSDSHAAEFHGTVDRVEVDCKRGHVWQKEALINKGFSILSSDPTCTQYAWMDADVLLTRTRWDEQCQLRMDEERLLAMQPFQSVCHGVGKPEQSHRSVAEHISAVGVENVEHAGTAWVYDAEAFNKSGGLYPFNLVGGGDRLAVCAMHGAAGHFISNYDGNPAMQESLNDWQPEWCAAFDGRVACLQDACAVSVAPKGSHRSPSFQILSRLDPSRHVRVMPNGGVQWTDDAPLEMVKAVREHLRLER